MAGLTTYNPFPYSGSQAIISSDRVWLYARRDSTLLFGNNSVGLSSKGTINLDSNIYMAVFSPKIYLGRGSEEEKEPVILGTTFINALQKFCETVSTHSGLAQSGNDATRFVTFLGKLQSAAEELNSALPSTLSKTTFTK